MLYAFLNKPVLIKKLECPPSKGYILYRLTCLRNSKFCIYRKIAYGVEKKYIYFIKKFQIGSITVISLLITELHTQEYVAHKDFSVMIDKT